MSDQITNEKVSKKLSHAILFILDLFCIWGGWIGCKDLTDVLAQINNEIDAISFGSRDGFYILGVGLPLLHLLVIIEYFGQIFVNTSAL